MTMDNMNVRKTQLEKLDEFVHTLYKEVQVFKNYGIDLPDLEILYLHIHDLIQEMLQAKTSQEFMQMMEELHKAIAGVLIIVAPANANQVAQDMKHAHANFDVDAFLNELQKKGPMKTKTNAPDDQDIENSRSKEELEKDKEDLINTLDLQDVIKNTKTKENMSKTSSDNELDKFEDPYDDLWNK